MTEEMRSSNTRFKEDCPKPEYNNQTSNVGQLFLEINNSLKPIDESISILYHCQNSALLVTLEHYKPIG